jgi:hypothetical protein
MRRIAPAWLLRENCLPAHPQEGAARFCPVRASQSPPLSRSNAAAPQVPLVKLDDSYYKLVDKLERLVKAPPSLKLCRSLTVKGPVRFEKGIVIK